jgi:HAD superfamily hydrolase (TIGR01509 family)
MSRTAATLRALVFDVDGTLADTEELHRQAFNAAFREAGLPWEWDEESYAALLAVTGGRERMRHFIAQVAVGGRERSELDALVPALHEAKTRHYVALLDSGALPLRPGVACLAAEALARRVRLAIATTTARANVGALLAPHFGADWESLFFAVVCGEDVSAKKPSPEAHRRALSALGVAPEEAVALEDSANGLAAAKGAGLYTVVTPTRWSAGQDFRDADLLLRDLASPPRRTPGPPWLTLGDLERERARSPRASEEVRA